MSLVIVLTVLNASCILSILFSSLWSIFAITILNSLSGRLPIFSLFVWSCEFLPWSFICNVFLCLFIFFPLTCSTWGLLSPAVELCYFFLLIFALEGKCWFGGLCWFLVEGDLCLCSHFRELNLSPWRPGIFSYCLEVALKEFVHILMHFKCIGGGWKSPCLALMPSSSEFPMFLNTFVPERFPSFVYGHLNFWWS